MPSWLLNRTGGALWVGIAAAFIGGCYHPNQDAWMDDSQPLILDEVARVEHAQRAPVAEPVPPPPPAAAAATDGSPPVQANTYTVRRGDTLWSIAQRTYADGKRWRDIVIANEGLDPAKLRIGQKIVLP